MVDTEFYPVFAQADPYSGSGTDTAVRKHAGYLLPASDLHAQNQRLLFLPGASFVADQMQVVRTHFHLDFDILAYSGCLSWGFRPEKEFSADYYLDLAEAAFRSLFPRHQTVLVCRKDSETALPEVLFLMNSVSLSGKKVMLTPEYLQSFQKYLASSEKEREKIAIPAGILSSPLSVQRKDLYASLFHFEGYLQARYGSKAVLFAEKILKDGWTPDELDPKSGRMAFVGSVFGGFPVDPESDLMKGFCYDLKVFLHDFDSFRSVLFSDEARGNRENPLAFHAMKR